MGIVGMAYYADSIGESITCFVVSSFGVANLLALHDTTIDSAQPVVQYRNAAWHRLPPSVLLTSGANHGQARSGHKSLWFGLTLAQQENQFVHPEFARGYHRHLLQPQVYHRQATPIPYLEKNLRWQCANICLRHGSIEPSAVYLEYSRVL